ncbi:alpha-L-fucosidase 2 [Paenibacillus anaericanus]|uniref:glycoside hydrolase family 95 protein n=1 Tax=Paenibacillus anaericanus TaxID=170367 RepID=UPI002787BD01|nr:glycoside hydrolase family 95 protein [Paenibacillus anaericanus]MDQ0090237.1 alpha-L-fucosidase 2 [Paenibacillus anaericanus]
MAGTNHEKTRWKLWYNQPASRWEEALPVGNGRIGGMVYGGDRSEVIALNEDTLWSGFPRDTQNYDAIRHLSRARELIFSGKYKEAESIVNSKMLGYRSESYQPLGNLKVEHHGEVASTEYYRGLDLETGIAESRYSHGAASYTREVFASAVDQVLAVRFASPSQDYMNLSISLDTPLRHTISETLTDNGLKMNGRAPSHIADNYLGDHPQSVLYEEGLGLSFEAQILILHEGGTLVRESGVVKVKGATSVTVLLAAATDFAGHNVMPGSGSEDSLTEKCTAVLNAAAQLGYEELRNRHIQDHESLFGRLSLDLGQSYSTALPTDERLANYKAGKNDPDLEALYFQYGRYLLMASSRPGTQPAHLQGIWNPHMQPPWNSNYTTNINTEMNYWPAEVCNLSECHEPLFGLIRDLSETGARTARIHYGARGWTAHHNVDLWRAATPSDGDASWAFWPMSGVWLCRHLWEHYDFTRDKGFLRDTAYPLLKGAAEFCLDWLVPAPNGMLVTAPSTSPENKFLTADGEPCSVSAGSTMDLVLIRELFTHCIQAASILEIDLEWISQLEEAMEQMAKPEIGPDGRLLEWSEDFAEAEPGHRHVSHLYGLYPGNSISPTRSPELAEAARKSLQSRISQGGGHTGWSCAWLINLYARLRDGEAAHHFVNTLLSRSTYPNLFDDHPPFQIDGNFGGTAGIAEMLLQSHLDEIELLPALPKAWPQGNVSGLKARGGFEVEINWEMGHLVTAMITATRSGWCCIRYGKTALEICSPDGSIIPEGQRFWTEPNQTFFIS